jgi:hypothetical protein
MATKREIPNVLLEECRIIFRNFSGAEGRFNAAGKRNFNVLLDDDIAENMARDGWNVKYLEPREEGDTRQARIEVEVSYKGRPPRVSMITSRGKTDLTEDMIGILDWAEIRQTDVIIRPYQWDVNGKTGIKAYLKTIFVIIQEDELEMKYIDVPDTAQTALMENAEEQLAIGAGDESVPF